MARRPKALGEAAGGGRSRAAASGPTGALENIAREERAGIAYMFWGRVVTLGVLAAWLTLTLPFERTAFYLVAIAAFALLGLPPYLLGRRGIGGTTLTALCLLLDAGILSYLLIVPAPFSVADWTPQLNLRLPSFLFLGVFLVGMALSYSPALVVWTGIASICAWSAGFLWVATMPDSVTHTSNDMLDGRLSSAGVVDRFLDPHAVSLTTLSNQIVFLVLVTLLLALTVWRSRRLVRQQAAAEAQRSALARYFSPNILDELATTRDALDRTSVQPAAVLFADMVGFTAISERLSPDDLVRLLGDFHGRLARTTFAHGGTVDKYIGDAIMVHFGTPRSRPDDPVRALTCAAAMIADIAQWNVEREARGESPVGIGIGLHFGAVIVGNIGDRHRLEYTVLGDAVNVASRLERLTREIGTPLAVSDDLMNAVKDRGADPAAIAPGLRPDRRRLIRGRREPVGVWCA